MSDYSDCPPVLSQFLFYLETIRNVSPRTVNGYYIDLRLFFRYLMLSRGHCDRATPIDEVRIDGVTIKDIRAVTTMEVYEYLHFVMDERENNPNTRARKVSSLRSYFKYLTIKTHQLEVDPVKDIEVPSLRKSLPKFLSLEESLALLDSVDGEFEARDYCILTLFLNCGMRLSELVGINLSDIREDTIRIVGKGNKERIVYLNDACRAALKNCITARNARSYKNKDENALLLSRTGSRLTGRRVEQIVDEYLEKAGLAGRGYSAHKLRHTAATLMYRHGNVDILAIKEILGHEHVSTTEIYTHISDDKLRDAASASPLSEVRRRGVKPKGLSADVPSEKAETDGAQQSGGGGKQN
ncbi:MAG: tyrosine-type recombinase/integrase [Oscillospiraceae bacterium]|nr:tyrosine-type recombinase/integrase [Oscillospiraceae bacterium]